MPRNTTLRDKHRCIIAQDEPPCAGCGEPIDYQAHHLNPLAFTIDHIVPLAVDPDGDVLENLQPMHRKCNRAKSNKAPDWRPSITFVTTRHWT